LDQSHPKPEIVFEKEIENLEILGDKDTIIGAKAQINSKWLVILQGKEDELLIRRFDIQNQFEELHPPLFLGEKIVLEQDA
jgi:hypothetical protein